MTPGRGPWPGSTLDSGYRRVVQLKGNSRAYPNALEMGS